MAADNNYKYIAFDMDGVILSSEDILAGAYVRSIEHYNLTAERKVDPPDLETILHEVGKPVKVIFRNLFPDLSEDERDGLNKSVLDFLVEDILAGNGRIFDGIAGVIKESARRAKLLVASNGRAPYLEAILEHYGLKDYFEPRLYISPENPDKGSLLAAYQKREGFLSAEILMIGDRASDADAATAIGCDFLACKYGHGEAGEWKTAKYFAASPQEISELLLQSADN